MLTEYYFLIHTRSNLEFHETGSSKHIEVYNEKYENLKLMLEDFHKLDSKRNFNLNRDLSKLDSLLVNEKVIFDTLIASTLKRGFKNYGLEGELRKYAHALENGESSVNLSDVLSLRRREKDFMMRKDSIYVNMFNQEASNILAELKKNQSKNRSDIELLTNYASAFERLVFVENIIGSDGESGLLLQHKNSMAALKRNLEEVSQKVFKIQNQYEKNLYLAFILLSIVALLASVYMAVYYANKRSNPLLSLKEQIEDILQTKTLNNRKLSVQDASLELNSIIYGFNRLLEKIEKQMLELNEKNWHLGQSNQELSKANNELDNFVYSVSHDLRSPLVTSLGLLDIAKQETSQNQKDEYLNLIEESLLKLDNFICDILNLSRNNRTDVVRTEINLKQFIEEIIKQNAVELPNFKYEIKVSGSSEIYNDPRRIQMLLNNLVSNAIRYRDKEKECNFLVIEIFNDSNKCELNFSDNGIGIGKEHLAKIFNMFYRANENSRGSGLGLYIVKEVLEKLKGSIHVKSEIGVGTSFRVVLQNEVFVQNTTPTISKKPRKKEAITSI